MWVTQWGKIMAETVTQTYRNNISITQVLRAISTKDGRVSIPVQNGVSLKHVNGYSTNNSAEEISVMRAIAINNMIELLSREDADILKKAYNNFEIKKIGLKDLTSTMNSLNNKLKSHNSKQFSVMPQGFMINTTV